MTIKWIENRLHVTTSLYFAWVFLSWVENKHFNVYRPNMLKCWSFFSVKIHPPSSPKKFIFTFFRSKSLKYVRLIGLFTDFIPMNLLNEWNIQKKVPLNEIQQIQETSIQFKWKKINPCSDVSDCRIQNERVQRTVRKKTWNKFHLNFALIK